MSLSTCKSKIEPSTDNSEHMLAPKIVKSKLYYRRRENRDQKLYQGYQNSHLKIVTVRLSAPDISQLKGIGLKM